MTKKCPGCTATNWYAATDEERAEWGKTRDFCYCEPKIDMYGMIPKELLRNLPPWVGTLQKIGYWLMVPYALALLWMFWLWPLGEQMGLWHFPIAPVAAAGSTAGSPQPPARPHVAATD